MTKEKPKHLEGICFDRNGDMYFTSTYEGAVYFVDMKTGKQTLKWQDKDLKAACLLKLHKDGRMFISCIGTERRSRAELLLQDRMELQSVRLQQA